MQMYFEMTKLTKHFPILKFVKSNIKNIQKPTILYS